MRRAAVLLQRDSVVWPLGWPTAMNSSLRTANPRARYHCLRKGKLRNGLRSDDFHNLCSPTQRADHVSRDVYDRTNCILTEGDQGRPYLSEYVLLNWSKKARSSSPSVVPRPEHVVRQCRVRVGVLSWIERGASRCPT